MLRVHSHHHMSAVPTVRSRWAGVTQFALHFLEMCAPMCIGFAVGDVAYFAIARALGYSDAFTELPALSVVVVTINMTLPMVAWMRFRGMTRRSAIEMAAPMVVLALALLFGGWLGLIAMSHLALLEHGLMMPAMLVPMLLRHQLYTGQAG